MQGAQRLWQRILSDSKLEEGLADGTAELQAASWFDYGKRILVLSQAERQKGLSIKVFDGFTPEWAKFVLLNREGADRSLEMNMFNIAFVLRKL